MNICSPCSGDIAFDKRLYMDYRYSFTDDNTCTWPPEVTFQMFIHTTKITNSQRLMFVNCSRNWTVPKSIHISKNSQLVYRKGLIISWPLAYIAALFHTQSSVYSFCFSYSKFVSLLIIWKCVPLVDLLNALLWAGRASLPTNTQYFALGMQLSPGLQSLFSFHLGCGCPRKKKCQYKLIFKVPTRLRQELT